MRAGVTRSSTDEQDLWNWVTCSLVFLSSFFSLLLLLLVLSSRKARARLSYLCTCFGTTS